MGLIARVEFSQNTHTAPSRQDEKPFGARNDHFIQRLVAPDHIEQITVGVDTQRSADIIGARIFIDYQYVLAAACKGRRQTDNCSCLACARAT